MQVLTGRYLRNVTHTDRLTDRVRERGVVRSSDLAPLGIPRQTLARLTDRGVLERIDRGLYVLVSAEPTEHQSLAEAARRVPRAARRRLPALCPSPARSHHSGPCPCLDRH